MSSDGAEGGPGLRHGSSGVSNIASGKQQQQQVVLDVMQHECEESLVEVTVASRRLSSILTRVVASVNTLAGQVAALQEADRERCERQAALETDVRTLQDDVSKNGLSSEFHESIERLRVGVESLSGRADGMQDAAEIQDARLARTEAVVQDVAARAIPDIAPLEAKLRQALAQIADSAEHAAESAAKLGLLQTHTDDHKALLQTQGKRLEETTDMTDLLYRIFSLRPARIKEASLAPPANPGACPAPLAYLASLPIFCHVFREIDKQGRASSDLCDAITRDAGAKNAEFSDALEKLLDRVGRKLDVSAFQPVEGEVRAATQRIGEARREVLQLSESMAAKVDHDVFDAHIQRLDTIKADHADIVRLPGKDAHEALKRRLDVVDERLRAQLEHVDSELRQIRGAAPRPSATFQQADPAETDRLRRQVEALQGGQARLEEAKLDKSEWVSTQEYIEQLTDALDRVREAQASASHGERLHSLKRTSVPAAAAMPAADEPPPKQSHPQWGSGGGPLVPADQTSATTVTVPTAVVRPGGSRPSSAGLGFSRNVLQSRPMSAASTTSSLLDFSEDQISVQLPLHHIPAGLRMGRPSRLATVDGGVTNATITPSVDMVGRHPLSPLTRPRITA